MLQNYNKLRKLPFYPIFAFSLRNRPTSKTHPIPLAITVSRRSESFRGLKVRNKHRNTCCKTITSCESSRFIRSSRFHSETDQRAKLILFHWQLQFHAVRSRLEA